MQSPDASQYHQPVLAEESLEYLSPKPGETVLDATLGGGGHSAAIARRIAPGGMLIGIDRDQDALDAAGPRLQVFHNEVSIVLIHSDFANFGDAIDTIAAAGAESSSIQLDGAMFDLGVSSHQLDDARGFSFRRDDALDMRMDASPGQPSARDLLARSSEEEIARMLWEYGEERFSRRIAHEISERNRNNQWLETTLQLASLVESAVSRSAWPRDIHVATRTFQAVRIAVNDELGQLSRGLNTALDRMKPGGRVVVISYHSLEDRIVKQTFSSRAGRTPGAPGSSPAAFLPSSMAEPEFELLTRKPRLATAAEISSNPRSRSAKLRAVRRMSR